MSGDQSRFMRSVVLGSWIGAASFHALVVIVDSEQRDAADGKNAASRLRPDPGGGSAGDRARCRQRFAKRGTLGVSRATPGRAFAWRQAFEWFQKAAASNDPLGAYKLGCYYDGQGAGVVTSDSNEALKYKLVAAKAGYALAQHDVALLYDRQENSEEAVKWWKMAGDQGHPKALYNLSGSYFQGKGAPKDLSLAYAYYKLSKLVPKDKVSQMATILSKPELESAEKLVSQWKPQPTALTLKAKRGIEAAEEHVKNGR